MMNQRIFTAWEAVVLVLIIAGGGFSALYLEDLKWQRDALAHGNAEYLTTESGQQVWRWNP